MPAANAMYYTATPTVNSTAYTAATAPSVSSTLTNAGKWSIYNPSGTLSLIVSVDGTNDCVTIPPGMIWNGIASANGLLWIRLSAAGSVVPTCNVESL